jgi:hypothetical protein
LVRERVVEEEAMLILDIAGNVRSRWRVPDSTASDLSALMNNSLTDNQVTASALGVAPGGITLNLNSF